VAVALAGGYARQVEDTVEIYAQTIRAAVKFMESQVGYRHAD
jgi:hypothetical protein